MKMTADSMTIQDIYQQQDRRDRMNQGEHFKLLEVSQLLTKSATYCALVFFILSHGAYIKYYRTMTGPWPS